MRVATLVALIGVFSLCTAQESTILEPWAEKIHKSQEKVLVEFTAPWCSACKNFEKEWKEIGTQLSGKVKTYLFDCDEKSVVCESYGVDRFPFFGLFKNGKVAKYTGELSKASLITWATDTEPSDVFTPSHATLSKSDLKKETQSNSEFEDPLAKFPPYDPKHPRPNKESLEYIQAVSTSYSKRFNIEFTEITPSNFDVKIKVSTWIVLLHSASRFDEEAAKEFFEAAKTLKLYPGVKFGVANYASNRQLINKFEVNAFPTVLIYQHGSKITHLSGIKNIARHSIVELARKHLQLSETIQTPKPKP